MEIKSNNLIKKTMSVREFANEYGIGVNKSYELVHIDTFPKIVVGKKIIIVKSMVDDWLEKNIGKYF